MIIHMILYSCKSILLHIVCYSAFFKNLRICSAKFANSMLVWAHVTDWMRYIDYGVRKNDKWCYYIFYHFYYLMLNQIFRDFPPRFFAYCTSSMKITIWIPVADLSLDQACLYHIRAHHKIEYKAQNDTNFYTFISASGKPSSRKK